jgi:hypothetical protein
MQASGTSEGQLLLYVDPRQGGTEASARDLEKTPAAGVFHDHLDQKKIYMQNITPARVLHDIDQDSRRPSCTWQSA